MPHVADIQILGGGPAGLSAAYHAEKLGLDYALLESSAQLGGNCRTMRLGDFRFDTGAHRLHDKDPEVTAEIRSLLGDDLLEVHAPSEIFSDGRFFAFPLRPLNLARQLNPAILMRIIAENLWPKPRGSSADFAGYATSQYGRTLADRFLLSYSAKLWGEDPSQLSTDVAGGRLKGLDLASVARDLLFRGRRKARHLDGSFLYPSLGFGMIAECLAARLEPERIQFNSKVTGLIHDGGRIVRLEVNGARDIEGRRFVNTLPISLSVRLLSPPPPAEVLAAAESIRYRNLVLCVFCLDRPYFSPNASIYFPDEAFPFTRLYEPKRRSHHMAPEGQTAIVLELPCFSGDPIWGMPAEELRETVFAALKQVGPISSGEVVDFTTLRLPFAYPVLQTGLDRTVSQLVDYLGTFRNLHLTGRSSLFRYLHFHDLFRDGRELVAGIANVDV